MNIQTPTPIVERPASRVARVLVVDDEKSILLSVQEFLRDAGYEADAAEDSRSALALLADGNYDVVISDIVLPGVSGVTLLKAIREASPDVQVIMLTGEPTVETAADAVRSGASDYLAKPVTKDEILNAVRRAAATKRMRDDNQRLQAEALRFQDALKVSEARYRILFDSSRDAIMTLEPPAWKFTSGNPATVRMFKAAREQDFTAHEPWTLSPERQPDGRASADGAKEMIETAMRNGSHVFEWTHKRINGESFAANVLLSRVETDGKAFLQATVRDITEARRVQTQIESLHRRNEIILNSAGEGIYGVDLEGNSIFTNLAALKLLGYTREELIGRPQHALIHHTRPDGLLYPADECPAYTEFTDGRVHHIDDDVFWRKDGTSFPVEYFINPMRDEQGALIGAVVTFNDVTERKQAEVALRESHQLIEGIINAIPVRVFWKDKNLLYLGCNTVFSHDAGVAESKDIVGKDDFQLAWREQAELYRADDRQVIESGCAKLLIEEPQTTPTGDTLWLITSKVPLRDPAGEVYGVLGTYMDVTDHKRMEEQKKALTERLRKEQKLVAVGTLACGVGHEINNPLMGIINYAQLIKDRLKGKDETLEELVGEIGIEAERIAGIVRGLSVFATRDIVTRAAVPVSDLVESALSATRATLSHDHITLAVDVQADLPAVSCDRLQIVEVLTSLLSNARDALNERYPGQDENKNVVISATAMTMSNADRHIRAVRFTVEDHGTGIPDAVREHIFDPFFTTKDKSGGAGSIGKGLGLFVSYATVQEHGGALSVESEVGQWTRVHVELPLVPEPPEMIINKVPKAI